MEVRLELPSRLDTKIEIGVYYVVAEALTNAVRHAHATLICVRAAIVDAPAANRRRGTSSSRSRTTGSAAPIRRPAPA